MKNKTLLFLALLGVMIFTSCSFLNGDMPFLLSQADCVLESESGNFGVAGIRFFLWNLSGSDVRRFRIVFNIFKDKDGGTVLSCGNQLSVDVGCSLEAGEKQTFEASLDRYLLEVPETPYYVGSCYIESVEYADGSTWYDPAGLYYVGRK